MISSYVSDLLLLAMITPPFTLISHLGKTLYQGVCFDGVELWCDEKGSPVRAAPSSHEKVVRPHRAASRHPPLGLPHDRLVVVRRQSASLYVRLDAQALDRLVVVR